jgi:hypothetical protein
MAEHGESITVMATFDNLKSILDWGKRIQFVFQVVVLLFSASTVAAVRAVISYYTHIPNLWHAPIYFAVAGTSLLLFASVGNWWNKRRKKDGKSEETTEIIEDIMRQGAIAATYEYMSGRAYDLHHMLEDLWHRWNNAGEKLIHPLDIRIDKLSNFTTEHARDLMDAKRDFMVLYSHHLSMMKMMCPDFTSQTITIGYPSDIEYVQVRACLSDHSKELGKLANKTWERYGKPLGKL